MNRQTSKFLLKARRLIPIFGLLLIALAGFCRTDTFAGTQFSEGDGVSPVAASLNRNLIANGDSLKGFPTGFRRLRYDNPVSRRIKRKPIAAPAARTDLIQRTAEMSLER